jgi:hypothetical protein
MKKLIVFDLDGTLAESKSALDAEMATLLGNLLGIVQVAVISGGSWQQFETQLLTNLPHDERLKGLSLLPTCGTKFYQYTGDWEKIYSEDFTADEKEKIFGSFRKAITSADFQAAKVWGEVIEDRGSQITFSALGQQAPIEEKKKWDPDFTKRKKIKAILDDLIPEFSSIKPTGSGNSGTSSTSRFRTCFSSGMPCSRAGMTTPLKKQVPCPSRSKILMRRNG